MKKAYSLSLTLLLFLILHTMPAFAACYDPRDVIKKAKDPKSHIPIIAMHRGLWGDGNRLPENSMGAFIAADKMCMEGVETDVRLTKDNVPIFMHDDRYGRTTDVYEGVETEEIKKLNNELNDVVQKMHAPGISTKDAYKYSQIYQELNRKINIAVPKAKDVAKFKPEAPDSEVEENPKVEELNWAKPRKKIEGEKSTLVKNLHLLINPNDTAVANNVTGYHVLRVQDFYDEYYANKMSTVVFLEVKKKEAVPIILEQLFRDTRDYNQNFGDKPMYATEFTVIKFNAAFYPTPEQYRDEIKNIKLKVGNAMTVAIPDPIAFPAFNGWNLGKFEDANQTIIKDPYEGSIKKWIDDDQIRIGIELNLKVKNGILQEYYDKALATKKVVLGNFNALPDYMRVNPTADGERTVTDLLSQKNLKLKDASYRGENGKCCQGLQAMLGEWTNPSGKEIQDSDDQRWDPAFMVGKGGEHPAFRIITTDDYNLIKKAFDSKKKSGDTEAFAFSPMASPLVFHLDEDAIAVYNYIENSYYSGDVKLPDVKTTNAPAAINFNGKTYVFVNEGSEIKYLESSSDTRITAHLLSWKDAPAKVADSPDSKLHKIPGCDGAILSPAVAVYEGYLWVFYKSSGGGGIKTCITKNLNFWINSTGTITDSESMEDPAATVFNGELYLFYRSKKGKETDKDGTDTNPIVYKTYNNTTKVWTKSTTLKSRAMFEPGVTTLNGKLYLFFRNSKDKLVYSTFNGDTWEDAKDVQRDASKSTSSTSIFSYTGVPVAALNEVWVYYNSHTEKGVLSVNHLNPDGSHWSGEVNLETTLSNVPSVF